MTDHTLARALVAVVAAGVVPVFAVTVVLVFLVHPNVATEPSTRSAELGQLLDPAQREDARLVAGLPRETLRTRSGQLLFAVFIGAASDLAAWALVPPARRGEARPVTAGSAGGVAFASSSRDPHPVHLILHMADRSARSHGR